MLGGTSQFSNALVERAITLRMISNTGPIVTLAVYIYLYTSVNLLRVLRKELVYQVSNQPAAHQPASNISRPHATLVSQQPRPAIPLSPVLPLLTSPLPSSSPIFTLPLSHTSPLPPYPSPLPTVPQITHPH